MPVPVSLRSLVAVLAIAATVSGCSGNVSREDIRAAEGSFTGVSVTGDPGSLPEVRIAAPLTVSETRSEEVVAGLGAPVAVDQLLVLELTVYNARTGARAVSTHDPGQRPLAVKDTDGTLFPALSDALLGLRQGSRLVMMVTAQDGYGDSGAPQHGIGPDDALVLVADVIAVPPDSSRTLADGTPAADPQVRLELRDGVPLRVVSPRAPRPRSLRTEVLLAGDGPQIGRGSLVVLHSLAQVSGRALPFDSTYTKEPALVPIGTGTVVRAWDDALVGVRAGTRLAILAPPEFAFGSAGKPPAVPADATIIYVVDVLGVS